MMRWPEESYQELQKKSLIVSSIESGTHKIEYKMLQTLSWFVDIRTTASIRDQFLVRVSFLEIYNEKLTDLLVREKLQPQGCGEVHVTFFNL